MSIFISFLKKYGNLDEIHITICNVGSRKSSSLHDYGSQEWGVFAPRLSIYGFDADADACDAANADIELRQINWIEKHIPLALSNKAQESTLYVTKHPMSSSLYPPNEPLISRFVGLPEVMNLDFTVEIETTTLDTYCNQEKIELIDFLQIDVQGAELQVLEGAKEILERSVLAIQTEVEFCSLYIDQPLFTDIDIHLRKQGFALFHLKNCYRPRVCSPVLSIERPGQLLWADAFYLRDLILEDVSTQRKTPDNILKLACIADILEFPDYALELLEYLTLNYGNKKKYNCANSIIEGLEQFPHVRELGINSLPIIARIRDYASGSALDLLQTG